MIDGLVDANCDSAWDRTDHACLGIYDLDDLAALDGPKDKLASNFGLDASPQKWNAQTPLALAVAAI